MRTEAATAPTVAASASGLLLWNDEDRSCPTLKAIPAIPASIEMTPEMEDLSSVLDEIVEMWDRQIEHENKLKEAADGFMAALQSKDLAPCWKAHARAQADRHFGMLMHAEMRADAKLRKATYMAAAGFMAMFDIPHPSQPYGLSAQAWLKKWDIRLP